MAQKKAIDMSLPVSVIAQTTVRLEREPLNRRSPTTSYQMRRARKVVSGWFVGLHALVTQHLLMLDNESYSLDLTIREFR